MNSMFPKIKQPSNEPILDYAPQTEARSQLQTALNQWEKTSLEIPIIINGKPIQTQASGKVVEPHRHQHVLATFHQAGANEVNQAIAASQKAKHDWENMPFQHRAAIFLKAAELLSTKYRYDMNAITMLNQSKNPFQSEIDAVAELVDFLNFNVYYMQRIYEEQPPVSEKGTWNYLEHRALEGFVFAVTPFNFTSIAGNLPTAPAMMGNTVLWKPASTAVLSGYFFMQILQEAGLPDGVINFLPGSGSQVGNPVLASSDFAGIHFTGSTRVFQHMWKTIGENIADYKTYPRIVGETGGKDFVFAHASADVDALATALVRGAFEFQGQKCSAASRAYIPQSLWPQVQAKMQEQLSQITVGPVQEFSHFMNAVIDQNSFDNIMNYIRFAQESTDADIIFGGKGNDSEGYFIEPTVIRTTNPHFKTMEEEIFGPVLTIYVYADQDFEDTLTLCDATSPYALTGAVFAQDRQIIHHVCQRLRHAAGNFYINDKPTGAVVGQQPFGGSRGSGTNDKAGSLFNMLKWTSARNIKENFNPPVTHPYPFMQ